MVTNQSGARRNGVQDFISLRTTALIITAYAIFMAWFFFTTEEITFTVWRGLFAGLTMKVFTLATLVATMIHIRIGMWQVLTDYVKALKLRATIQFLINLIAFIYVAVGLFVLLGV
ncbi:succinate dehydrogenase, hydrophobic membrane anchor protein [Alteromonas pelagimontana]|uniref:Succinate dehydrogenase hydrophobic membrane anchor subunit n=1 Tax=Alteromonas pelagimontana TaxID=1858656 RepID=A0A6M4MH28_9ALTE|nr:succinate dehydrogenase, hydrophobic membrane anchor protein [Alteromonas pelagimontana]QJR82521.1 succinate dehydrogenase, hydrophobic membrane anchor protein [Alteromonas pelagimontana]